MPKKFIKETSVFHSPAYEEGGYPSSLDCSWTASVDIGNTVKITWTDMDIDVRPNTDASACTTDYVEVCIVKYLELMFTLLFKTS